MHVCGARIPLILAISMLSQRQQAGGPGPAAEMTSNADIFYLVALFEA